jgi:hypothetical protein
MAGLRAIVAIFGAVAGFNREQGADLYRVGIKVLPMDGLCGKHEVIKWQVKEGGNVVAAPIIANLILILHRQALVLILKNDPQFKQKPVSRS